MDYGKRQSQSPVARRQSIFDVVSDGGAPPFPAASFSPTLSSAPFDPLVFSDAAKDTNPMPPPPRPDMLNTRMNSGADGSRNGKRLSLSFPIQLRDSQHTSSSRKHTPSSSVSLTPGTPSRPRLTEYGDAFHGDPSTFLVDLAAQERRVLELREELQRAEEDLGKFKRHFAVYEATKKRDELRHVQRMRPLSNVESSGDDSAGASRKSSERAARTAASAPKNPRRTIMSAQGHTRALSLLSPDRGLPQPPQRMIRRLTEPDGSAERPRDLSVLTSPAVSISTPAISTMIVDIETRKGQLHAIPKDAIIQTGRRMAEDLKDGLWTFLDDLRQATVGDEGINGPNSRHTMLKGPMQSAVKRSIKDSPRGSNRASPTRGVSKRSSKSSLRSLKGESGGYSKGMEMTSKANAATKDDLTAQAQAPTDSRKSSSASVNIRRPMTIDDNWDNWESRSTDSQSPGRDGGILTTASDRSPRSEKESSSTSLRLAYHDFVKVRNSTDL